MHIRQPFSEFDIPYYYPDEWRLFICWLNSVGYFATAKDNYETIKKKLEFMHYDDHN